MKKLILINVVATTVAFFAGAATLLYCIEMDIDDPNGLHRYRRSSGHPRVRKNHFYKRPIR